MSGPTSPRAKPHNLDCRAQPALSLDSTPTLKRYADALLKSLPGKVPDGTAGDSNTTVHHFKVSQLPPLPSSGELQRLQQELTHLQQSMVTRNEILTKNIHVLRDWLPPEAEKAQENVPINIPRSKEGKVDKRKDPVKKSRLSSIDDGDRAEAKLPKIKLKIPSGVKLEMADDVSSASEAQSSNYKKRRREKDHEDGSDNEDKKRTNHGSASNSKLNGGRGSLGPEAAIIPGPKTGTASHRGIAPKAKPKSSKKSGAHKNNKLKKRHSILEEDETPTPAQTPELEDKLGQKSLEGDFTKAKVVQNQIPIQNFWSFVDQFYRPLTEEDLKFLEFEGDEVTPYVVPPLGRSYKEQWADEEGKQFSDSGASANPFIASATQEYPDTGMLEGNAYIQPLSERIIASLMENRIIGTFTPPAPFPPEETEEVVNFKASGDMMDLEHRMRNELRYIGLIDDDEVDMNVDDQDEISSELRSLQSQLRSQTSVNRMRKRQLRDIATKWMGWQEYNGVLDDINKNIEQAYVKRFRTPAKSKGKKRISRGEYRPMGENVMQHLNNRKRLISELGVFLPADAFTMPTTSIYTPS